MDPVNDEPGDAPASNDAQAFAALEQQAAMIEGAVPGAAPGAAATPDTTAADLLGALTMARLMVAPMFGWWADFPRVWSDGTLQGIADGGAAVMRRHGWTLGGLMEDFGPYVTLLMAAAPPAFVTYQAVKAHREEQRRPPAPPPAPPAPAPAP